MKPGLQRSSRQSMNTTRSHRMTDWLFARPRTQYLVIMLGPLVAYALLAIISLNWLALAGLYLTTTYICVFSAMTDLMIDIDRELGQQQHRNRDNASNGETNNAN